MNAKTLEAVRRHGEALLAAFPNATEKDPVALCKKLRRIETAISRWTLQACNGPEVSDQQLDAECNKALSRVMKILIRFDPSKSTIRSEQTDKFVINRDPRGYALKLSSEWTRAHNDKMLRGTAYSRILTIPADLGGYGILAPDLTSTTP